MTAFNNSPAEILRQLLIESSGALFTDPDLNLAWPLFVSSQPDAPDNSGCIYDTEGVNKYRLLASGKNLPFYGLQIKVRALKYRDAFGRLNAVFQLLQKVHRQNVTITDTGNTYAIDTITRSTPIMSLGQDEKRRASCVYNALMVLLVSI